MHVASCSFYSHPPPPFDASILRFAFEEQPLLFPFPIGNGPATFPAFGFAPMNPVLCDAERPVTRRTNPGSVLEHNPIPYPDGPSPGPKVSIKPMLVASNRSIHV